MAVGRILQYRIRIRTRQGSIPGCCKDLQYKIRIRTKQGSIPGC